MRHAMGVAVFFGMLGVTLFGLMLTPVFYVVLRTLAGGKIHVAGKDSAGTACRRRVRRLRMLEGNKMDNMHNTNGLMRFAKVAAASTLLATLLAACAVGLTTSARMRRRPPHSRKRRRLPPANRPARGRRPSRRTTRIAANGGRCSATRCSIRSRRRLAANQNLKAAAARVEEARAATRSARSQWFPQVGAGFGPTREGLSSASQFQPQGTA